MDTFTLRSKKSKKMRIYRLITVFADFKARHHPPGILHFTTIFIDPEPALVKE